MQGLNSSADARLVGARRSMAGMSLIWWLWRATNLYAILLVAMVGTHIELLQVVNGQAPAPSPAATFPNCQGVVLTYNVSDIKIIYPYLPAGDPLQPYSFAATATITNEGYNMLSDWEMGIQFNYSEILVSATNAVLADGTSFPAHVGNGTILTGYPAGTIMNAISTAGDLSQIQVQVNIVGTEFGSDGKTSHPLPLFINLTNSGYNCSNPSITSVSSMRVCCAENTTANATLQSEEYQPLETGDITISYDVIMAYEANYWAQVTISNNDPIGRLDYWNLTWDWQEGEFINKLQGAQALSTDTDLCVYGRAEQQYSSGQPDLNSVASCDKSPHIVDLPPAYYNTSLGEVPFCCRNGTLLPATIDPSQSKSVFKMNVYKLNPFLNVTHLDPPANFAINSGNQTGTYNCGQPQLVTPSQFADPSGLLHTTSALKSWQVTCNYTKTLATSPKKCCVSFSAYTNDSIIPCKTYACGAPATPPPTTCNTTAPALLLPYGALTIPPDNRTAQLVAWADINHWSVPNPLPCESNCGVSINWHIVSNYTTGWSARMSVFDWSTTTFPNWFVAVDLGAAGAGFQSAYSFNATRVPQLNDTLILQGIKGYSDYLLGTQGVYGASNYSYGIEQSVFGFTTNPGISVDTGYGFPQKVWFNGEECSMPDYFPTSGAALHLVVPRTLVVFLLALFVFTLGLIL